MTVVKLVTRALPSDTLGGRSSSRRSRGPGPPGSLPFAYFLGLLSVNLGILNLLPIPILDGGHLLFFSVEGLMRKPISPRCARWPTRWACAHPHPDGARLLQRHRRLLSVDP